MKYEILVSADLERLESMINERISQGWEPLGGISVSSHWETGEGWGQADYTYAQAVILKDKS